MYKRTRALKRNVARMGKWGSRSPVFKKLWGYSVGFYAVWVAHTGRRTGLLGEIAREPASAQDLALRTGLYLPAVEAWCSAALALGFLTEKKGRSASKLRLLPRQRSILLDSRDPEYLGGQFSYLALRSLEYAGLDDLFREGRTRETSLAAGAIEQATEWDHQSLLRHIRSGRNKMHVLLERGCRFLDVGCGTGALLEKLSARYPKSEFVGVEPYEPAADRAREALAGRPARIVVQLGEAMEFDSEFDIAYLGESLYAAASKEKVLSNCRRALKKGGTVAVVEGLLPGARENARDKRQHRPRQEDRLIAGMQIDFALQGHRFMSRPEVAGLLASAGFGRPRFTDLGGSVFLVTAQRRKGRE